MKQIKDYTDYLVTLDGKVFSMITMKFLKQKTNKYGYNSVCLYKKGCKKSYRVVENGIFYKSCTEAANILNISHQYLSDMLNGRMKNNTNFKYV